MSYNRYDNDGRFWLFTSSFGKWIIRIGLLIVLVLVILKHFGIID
ncbi:hypothetical protein [Pseudozobellia sp. WGM2]|nr:hypothetical protein [Pseudozobellia sp. WGM2]